MSAIERTAIEQAIAQRYSDSDGNGIPDTWEVTYFGRTGVDPNADADGDGLTNRREFDLGTNPVSGDTDRDGLPDGWEVTYGSDPSVANGTADPDGDGVSNFAELVLGTRPDHAAAPDIQGTINLRIYRPRD